MSVLAQEGVDVTVLIVDDASTDQSARVAATLARQDPRVQFISLQKNLGMIRAVNHGLREIDGKYFVKLDADDLLPQGSLKRSVALLEQYPNVGFVYGRPLLFFDDGSSDMSGRPLWTFRSATAWLASFGGPRYTVWDGDKWFAIRYQRALNCISQPEAVIRTSVLRLVGEYNVGLPHTSDLEMWLRLATVSDVGHINGVVQGYYRIHPNSMQRTVNAGTLTDLIGRRGAFISALSVAGERLGGLPELEATVRRKLAAEALDRACRAYDRDRMDSLQEDKLVEFAIATFPAAAALPEWHDLQRRRKRGRRSRLGPRSLVPALLRRTREEIAYLRWARTGV